MNDNEFQKRTIQPLNESDIQTALADTPVQRPLHTPQPQAPLHDQHETVQPSTNPLLFLAVAGIGAAAAVVTMIVTSAVFGLSWVGMVLVTTIFGGIQGIAILSSLVVAYVSGRILKLLHLRYVYPITFLSAAVVLGYGQLMLNISPKVLGPYNGGNVTLLQLAVVFSPFIAVMLMALLYVVLAFITNKTNHQKIGLVTFGMIAIALIASHFFVGNYSKEETDEPTVAEVSWSKTPTYIPSGLVEHSFGTKDYGACKDAYTEITSYSCRYDFSSELYPGYLSPETQATLGSLKDPSTVSGKQYAPNPFITITVMKEDERMKPYKLNNGRCDILAMERIGTSSLGNRDKVSKDTKEEVKLKHASRGGCSTLTTPGGKTQRYETPVQSQDERFKILEIPDTYYYEDDRLIITIRIASGSIRMNSKDALFFGDKNFQPELYKFIDSIK
jgi:hypothetical protein